MKKLILAALCAASLAGCAVPSATGPALTASQAAAQTQQQLTANWYIACSGWKAYQPIVAQKIATAPIASVKAILPVSHTITAQCVGPIPTNTQQATVQLTAAITQVLVTLGIQQVAQ